MKVYGSEISYFTGKLEAYLRYKEIAYERVAMTARHFDAHRVGARPGLPKCPPSSSRTAAG